ncbi:lytic murein transglycosylase [Paraconexibacter algicola]|uniref:Transglycosylase SLT domain-containing protein n=1 Tax=Paraconexibacter algicola TaxID=2133960 RepID=A0A2T4UFG8_9ACTN|nr:lytic murein transglycosylase [Paraconexibacter algicola]PTL56534.1 hypothetical protein C7Y72_16405 [Paraconexibacter algicola]
MNKRKLLLGLTSAGVVAAGFGSTVGSASADPRTFQVTLLGGAVITVTLDVPPGTPVGQIKIPGIELPILGIQEVGGTPAAPSPTATPAPTPEPAPGGEVTTIEGAPQVVQEAGSAEQETSGTKTRTPSKSTKAVQQAAEQLAAAKKDAAERRQATKLRNSDGSPTEVNPGFAMSLPGVAPIGVPNFFIEKFRIPPFLLPIYQAAGIEYGVRWEILAAINEIETDYGRNLNVSSAGALGWMQFIPSSWKAYGVDANRDGKKDPYNPVDAIFAAARYLKAAGADEDIRKAIFAYNHADWYVDSVLMRARLIGGLPADLVGSLTGLTQGQFPVHAKATYADDLSEADAVKRVAKGQNAANVVESTARRGIDIFAKAGSSVIAVQDGKIVKIGKSKRLGRFLQLEDAYGNTYTYAELGSVARKHPVPKAASVSESAVAKELELPKDKAPKAPASAGTQKAAEVVERVAKTATDSVKAGKERLFANPARPQAYEAGGDKQVADQGEALTDSSTFDTYFTDVYGLKKDDVVLKDLKVGSKVIAGTVLGRIGKGTSRTASHVKFEIRPAGRGAPRIDPKPILDGWKLLESTAVYRAAGKNPFFGPDSKNPTIGQILLMSKEALQKSVLDDPRIEIYECGRRDIKAGLVDRRVLATMAFLSASGLKPTVTSLRCGRSSIFTASGNLSAHPSGSALDIAKINGIPIIGNQGAGSVTELTIRRLLTLQGTMRPNQIISLMTFDGADNTIALPDHADHIHVGFSPLYSENGKLAKQLNSTLKPSQWMKLIDRIGNIDNPTVATEPSKYAIPAGKDVPTAAERANSARRGK